MSEEMKDVKVQETQVHDHRANGAVERWHRTLQQQTRAVLLQFRLSSGVEVPGKSIVLEWMLRHAVWSLFHFHRFVEVAQAMR